MPRVSHHYMQKWSEKLLSHCHTVGQQKSALHDQHELLLSRWLMLFPMALVLALLKKANSWHVACILDK